MSRRSSRVKAAIVGNLATRPSFTLRDGFSSRRPAMRCTTLATMAFLGAGLVACASAPPDPPERLIYAALGASDAAGVGAEPITRGYVFRIADTLDEEIDEVFLANLGVPGANTRQIDQALELFFQSEATPDLVTVWTGANDVIEGEDADDFEDALEDIFERLRERTDGVIAAANIPDLRELPRFRDDPNDNVTRERIEAFNEIIAEQADDYDVLLVDLYSEPVEDDLVSDLDGFHPKTRGTGRSPTASSR
jgi:acyl-CoA thioesterase I